MIHAELLKLRTIPAARGSCSGWPRSALFAVVLHGRHRSRRRSSIDSEDEQLDFVFRWGPLFGRPVRGPGSARWAMTGEFRHGTIRPTLLVTPRRVRVLLAKAVVALITGAVLGALAALTALAVGATLVDVAIEPHELIADATLAGALWGPLGVGLGALIRAQVPLVAGLALWIVLVENLIVGAIPDAEPFLPGTSNLALLLCTALALAAGTLALRRDV